MRTYLPFRVPLVSDPVIVLTIDGVACLRNTRNIPIHLPNFSAASPESQDTASPCVVPATYTSS